MTKTNVFSLLLHASLVVQVVMGLLILASIISWTIIFQKKLFLKKVRQSINLFTEQFWAGLDMRLFFNQLSYKTRSESLGMEAIFLAGFKEFLRLEKNIEISYEQRLQNILRAMTVETANQVEALELHLPFLATIGSVSPYIGLFGTVWGIMNAFSGLGMVEQATIAMVAPGISEALIATAMGLFAAIPAVIAYNRYTNQIEKMSIQLDNFQDDFLRLLTPE